MNIIQDKYSFNWVNNTSEEDILKELVNNRKLFFRVFEKSLDFNAKEIESQFLASKKIVSILKKSDLKKTDQKIFRILSHALHENPTVFRRVYVDLERVVSQKIMEELFDQNPEDPFLFSRICQFSTPNTIEDAVSKIQSIGELNEGYQVLLSNPKVTAKLIEKFARAGVDVNSYEKCRNFSPAAIHALIDAKVDLTRQGHSWRNLLEVACLQGENHQLIKKLIITGAFDHKIVQRTLAMACQRNFDLLEVLIDIYPDALKNETLVDLIISHPEFTKDDFKKFQIDVNQTDQNERTYLHRACLNNPSLISKLLEAGAEVNALDDEGNTPLHSLCQQDRAGLGDFLAILLESGAITDQKNKQGQTPLCLACRNNSELALFLLEVGANPRMTDNHKFTPLHYACLNTAATPEVISALLDSGLSYLVENEDKNTPLGLAIYYNPDALGPMIEHGYNINEVIDRGRTELHNACIDHPEVIPTLVRYGADSAMFDNDGNTPLHLLAANPKISADYLRSLFDAGANPFFANHAGQIPQEIAILSNPTALKAFSDIGLEVNTPDLSGDTVLHRAAEHFPGLIRLWLDEGANIQVYNKKGETPLHLACANSNMTEENLQQLINGELINAKDNLGRTPVHMACLNNFKLLDVLLMHHADVKALTNSGASALHYAASNEAVKRQDLQKLVDLGIDVNLQTVDDVTPLDVVLLNNPENVSEILALNPNINFKSKPGSAIFTAIKNPSMNPEILDRLIEQGAQVNARDRNNNTPLHYACIFNPHLIKFLVQKGADVNAENAAGLKPLHVALNADITSEQLKLLLDHGVSINDATPEGRTFLHFVCEKFPSLIPVALEFNPEVNVKDKKGISPLLEACYNPNVTPEEIKFLLDHGAAFQDRYKGSTILHAACSKNPSLIPFLMSMGGDEFLDVKNDEGELPIHLACKNPALTEEQLLSVIGEFVDEPFQGRTPLELACQFSNVEVITALVDNGADMGRQIDKEGVSLISHICSNHYLTSLDFAPLIHRGIKFKGLDDPDFPSERLAYHLLGYPSLVLEAIENKLSIRIFNEVLNTSDRFYMGNAYFEYVREPILGCFFENIRFELDQVENETEMISLLKEKSLEIFSSPKKFSESLFKVPLLLQSPELCKIFKEEILKNPDFDGQLPTMLKSVFQGNYSPQDIFNVSYAIDPSHLEKGVPTNKEIPPASNYDLNQLEVLFKEINFSDPSKPGYKDPSKLIVEKDLISVRDLEGGMHKLITGLLGSDMGAVIPEGGEEKQFYFENYKRILMHFGHLLPTLPPDERATVLIEIATMGLFCGARFLEAKNLYNLYFPQEEASEEQMIPTLEKYVCQNLLSLRLGILNNWANKLPGQSIHIFNRLMLRLGPTLHLPGSSMSFDDPYSGVNLSAEELLTKFYHEYTASALVENTSNYLLECLRDPKLRDEVINWFQDNVPSDYRVDHYARILERIEELEEQQLPNEKIRSQISSEFDEYLPYDPSIENAIQLHRKKSYKKEHKMIKLHRWKSDFYNPLFSDLKSMRRQPFEAIKEYLEQKGVVSEVFTKSPSELKSFMAEKEVTLEDLPELILDKHRAQAYLAYQESLIPESEWNKSYYEALQDDIKGKPRKEVLKRLAEEGIEVQNMSYKDILEKLRAFNYRENMIEFDDEGRFTIKPEGVLHMLEQMHILVKVFQLPE